MAGAQPTLTAITDDASRGGLFTQSNIANPVSGADVQGSTVNDSTITLSVTIDGTTQTGTFTTNQAADGTVALTFTGIGSGGTGAGNPVTGGALSDDGTMIVLTLQDLSTVSINVADLVTQAELDAAIAMVQTAMGATTFEQLTDTPNDLSTGAGQTLRVNAAGNAIEFYTPTQSGVMSTDFISPDDTVDIMQGTGAVELRAQPRLNGNTNLNDNVGAAGVRATSITLAADTGLILVNDGNDNITIQMAGTPLPGPQMPQVSVPPATSAADPAPTTTVEFRPRTGDTITAVTNVGVTGPNGAVPTATGDVNAGVGTVTIPSEPAGTMDGLNSPGDYTVTATVTTMGADGETRDVPESETINRFIPFYQNRDEPTTAVPGTASTTPWNTANGFTVSLPGTSTIWLAIQTGMAGLPVGTTRATQAGFPVRVVHTGTIMLPLADGTMQEYNVFRMQGGFNQTISNFS